MTLSNPLLIDKTEDFFGLEAFTDDNINVAEIMEAVW